MKRRLICLALAALMALALTACSPEAPKVTPAPTGAAVGTPVVPANATPGASLTPGIATPSPAPSALPTPAALTPGASTTPLTTPVSAGGPIDNAGDMKSYLDVIKNCDIVIMGQFIKFVRDDHAVRDIKDITKPNSNYHDNVKVYLFRVEAVYKGKVSQKEVYVALNYSDQNMKTMKEPKLNANFMEPNFDDTVILPLFYDNDLKWYINDQGVEPQRFVVDKDNKLVAKSNDKKVADAWAKISPVTVDGFKKEVDKAKK